MIENLGYWLDLAIVMSGIIFTSIAVKADDEDKERNNLLWAISCYLVVIAVSVV